MLIKNTYIIFEDRMTTFHLRTAGRLVKIAQSTNKETLFDDIGKDHPAKDLNAKSIRNFLGRGLKDIVFRVKEDEDILNRLVQELRGIQLEEMENEQKEN